MSFKKIICVLTAAAAVLSFAGCADSGGNTTTVPTGTSSSADDTDKLLSDMFTDRDIEVGYDENTDTVITLSDSGTMCKNSDVTVNGGTVTITAAGTYIIKGTLSDGSIVIDADKSDKIHIVLAGVSVSKSTTAPFYVKKADKVFVTLAPDTENTLTNTGDFTAIDDNNIDSCIFSKDDITFNGSGTLTVSSEKGHGIVCKDTLCFTGGTYKVTSDERHALSAKDDIRVMDGTFVLTSGKDGLNASNDEDSSLGFIYIEGGNFEIVAGDDGMHADSSLRILGGKINVTQSYEGLEGHTVEISGGDIRVKSSDDGINAAGGETTNDPMSKDADAYIRISGGTVYIDADGDGIDSNGDLYVLGGTVTVCGPTSGGDGALDYGEGASARISGGTVFAFGSSGMAENFNSAENQGAALVALSGNAGDTVTVKNSDGTALASAVSDKKYECVVVSCAEMTENGTFTVTNGTDDKEFTLSGFIYGENGGQGGFGGMGGNRGGAPFGGEMPTGENGEPPEIPTDESGNNRRMPDFERFTDENGEIMTMPNGEKPGEPPTGSDGRPERPADNTSDKNLQNSQNT